MTSTAIIAKILPFFHGVRSITLASVISNALRDFRPSKYMILCRVGEAQNLLISTNYSAAQIVTIVGYGDVTHFSKIIEKTVGLPPIRYRIQYRERMRGKRGQ